MKSRIIILSLLALLVLTAATPNNRRRMSPVETQAAQTQAINETRNDTSRINAKRRATAGMHYVNKNGFTVYVDTVSGDEWIDSTARAILPKMEYPLLDAVSVGINIWDPLMRAFGQKYGIADAWVELSLHNRYKPIFELGLGSANSTPSGMNFTYRSPLSVYFRLGANYNFLYNSDPDYSFHAGVRYGFAPFSYSIENVNTNDSYWGETGHFNIPSQNATAGWFEFQLGLRVKLYGPISAGWAFNFKRIIHESKAPNGKPWYIPGYGTRSNSVSGSFSVVYTIPLQRANKITAEDVLNSLNESATQTSTDTDSNANSDTETSKEL